MRRVPSVVILLLLVPGCALLWPKQSERDKALLAVGRDCEARVNGTQVRGVDFFGRVIYTYNWEAERQAFEDCYFDGAKSRGVAGPIDRPMGTLIRRGGG